MMYDLKPLGQDRLCPRGGVVITTGFKIEIPPCRVCLTKFSLVMFFLSIRLSDETPWRSKCVPKNLTTGF